MSQSASAKQNLQISYAISRHTYLLNTAWAEHFISYVSKLHCSWQFGCCRENTSHSKLTIIIYSQLTELTRLFLVMPDSRYTEPAQTFSDSCQQCLPWAAPNEYKPFQTVSANARLRIYWTSRVCHPLLTSLASGRERKKKTSLQGISCKKWFGLQINFQKIQNMTRTHSVDLLKLSIYARLFLAQCLPQH